MKEHNDSGQELSAAQHDVNDDDGCPVCGAPIQSVTRRGPSDVVIAPCGHNVAGTLSRDFPRTSERAMTDGGSRDVDEMDVEELRAEYQRTVSSIDFRRRDTDSEVWERHLELWAGLEARADVEFPECGSCGASTWRFATGQPASCAESGTHPDTEEKAETVWQASQDLQFGSTEVDA